MGCFKLADDLKPHPISELIPPMDGDTYKGFKADIWRHGLIEPIILYQGKILDGKERYRACRELGVDVWAREWEGGMDPVEYVISNNLLRHHKSTQTQLNLFEE
ncbi:hypothetical protein Dvar_19350 [Desulfosarcina variabilis str. Montpellier]